MVIQDGVAKFLELENRASQLLDELERLRDETKHYGQASDTLDEAKAAITGLTSSVASVTEQLQSLVAGLRDVGMPELLDRMIVIEAQLVEARAGVDESTKETQKDLVVMGQQLNALIEYHSKGILGKLFGKPRMGSNGS